MLKIKDNVNLNEIATRVVRSENDLEIYILYEEEYGSYIDVYSNSRNIVVENEYDIVDISDNCLDKLYDLIQSGIVEKVSDW